MDDIAFHGLPLDGQLAALEQALNPGLDRAGELLALAASGTDHAPLSWLAVALVRRNYLDAAPRREAFALFLCEQSETAVNRMLKAVTAEQWPQPVQAAISATLVRALEIIPIARLTSLCLLDRALKHNWPEERDSHVDRMRMTVQGALEQGQIQDVTVDMLAHVRAEAISELDAIAQAAGIGEEFRQRRKELAEQAIAVLAAVPKAVSQSNAEELLSRRVYTDPGHFLIELLQNAEDCEARTWKLMFDVDRIVVWHDGKPFDARDVVGVCSIGQTTKRKSQIGFFGVGFKSVYEVTQRPQIYSDVYAFEIADVSIPKRLSGRPADLPQTGTVLVLPLQRPDDPVRSPSALYAKAAALDPCVLLTLQSMDVLDLTLTEAAGGPKERRLVEIGTERMRTISETPAGTRTRFALEEAEIAWTGGERDAGRADRTEVMVGARLIEDGPPRPQPLAEGASTVYSFLPTAEHSGLAFFVQSHFDVPVDRERVNQESTWNQWIVAQIPKGLAVLASELLATVQDDPVASRSVAEGVLSILPLAAEIKSPVFGPVASGLAKAFADLAILPGLDGGLHTAKHTLVPSPKVAALFPKGDIDGALKGVAGRGRYALLDLDIESGERATKLARVLGAGSLGPKEVVAGLERELHAHPDGTPPAETSWLAGWGPHDWRRLYDLILDEVEAAYASSDATAGDRLLERLRKLPLIVTQQGTLHRPGPAGADAPCRADEELRAIFGTSRPFLAAELDDLGAAGSINYRVVDLLERLGCHALAVPDLVNDLPRLAPELRQDVPRLIRAMRLLDDAAWRIAAPALTAPIFPASDGNYYPAATDKADRLGVVRAAGGDIGAVMESLYDGGRPVLAIDHPAYPSAAGLLERGRVPALDLECLIADLKHEPPLLQLDVEGMLLLHAAVASVREDLPERVKRGLAYLPIWPAVGETKGLPLKGRGAVRIASDPAVAELLRDVPFLHPTVRELPHIADMNVEGVSAADVVKAIGPMARAPMKIERTLPNVRRVQAYLQLQAAETTQATRDRIARTALFIDDREQLTKLADTSVAKDAALRSLYVDHPGRRFLDPDGESLALAKALGLGDLVALGDVNGLVNDLWEGWRRVVGRPVDQLKDSLVKDARGLAAIHGYLSANASRLSAEAFSLIARLPIYPDQHGRLGVLEATEEDVAQEDFRSGLGLGSGPLDDRPLARTAHPEKLPELLADQTVLVATERVAGVLSALSIRVLAPASRQALAPLLSATHSRPADLEAALAAIADTFGPQVTRWDTRQKAARPAVLAFLTERRGEIQALLAPEATAGSLYRPLNELSLFQSMAGTVVSASRATDDAGLSALPELSGQALKEAKRLQLSEASVTELKALSPLAAPATLGEVVLNSVIGSSEDMVALEQQHPLLASVALVAALGALVADEPAVLARFPLVDNEGRLRTQGALFLASAEAAALIAQAPIAASLLHHRLGDVFSGSRRVMPLAAITVLKAFIAEDEASRLDRRQLFYRWLIADERTIMSDADCRQALLETPLFVSERGTLLAARDLVIDADLPDLGIDWRPAADIPAEALSLVARHLDVGKPALADLVSRYLRPAYDNAVGERNADAAMTLFRYFARRLVGEDAEAVQAMLPGLQLLSQTGDFVAATELYAPSEETRPDALAVFGARADTMFLAGEPYAGFEAITRHLGVRDTPLQADIEAILEPTAPPMTAERALAFARILRNLPSDQLDALPLATAAWVVNNQGTARRASELFAPEPQVQALVGKAPGRFPDPELWDVLPRAMQTQLGFRGVDSVTLEDVVGHITVCSSKKSAVPFRVYTWLEEGLAGGWLSPAQVRQRLSGSRWICDDENDWFDAKSTVGYRALSYFGRRRGYWEHGAQRCPTILQTFSIPRQMNVDTVLQFFQEVAAEVASDGDQAVLEREPPLPRMLLASAGWLGECGRTVEPDWQVVLATAVGPQNNGSHRLAAPTDPTLFVSDTPNLEAQFARVGRFLTAARGGRDDRVGVDRMLELARVRRLRSSLSVVIAQRGREVTEEHGPEVGRLCGLLRALGGVLPRVRAKRTHLTQTGWRFDERLGSVVERQAVKVIADLSVMVRLEGVGDAETQDKVAWDRTDNVLLVDQQVVLAPHRYTIDLANGVLPTVFDGAGGEELQELLHILLGTGDAASMRRYLDRQFYPVVDALDETGTAPMRERVAELLDFGLHHRLARRFPQLGVDADVSKAWRDPALWDETADTEDTQALALGADELARKLLRAAGVLEPSPELETTLRELLVADDLSQLPEALRGPQPLGPSGAATPGGAFDASAEPVFQPPADGVHFDPSGEPFATAPPVAEQDFPAPPEAEAESSGFWGRVGDVFGGRKRREEIRAAAVAAWLAAAPPWATAGNAFQSRPFIGPQLWAKPSALKAVAGQSTTSQLRHAPPTLPVPYAYAPQVVGGTFEHRTQRWLQTADPTRYDRLSSTGQRVVFEGHFGPGTSRLPLPVFTRLVSGPLSTDGGRLGVVRHSPSWISVTVDGPKPVAARYEVELLEVPELGGGAGVAEDAWKQPTLALSELPEEVRDFIADTARGGLGDWHRAKRVHEFAKDRYEYDVNFMDRPQVKAALSGLKLGQGNHHLTMLHASQNAKWLGHGVCYELNTLVVELLRHLGIPALVGTGWLLDCGTVDRADHLWAFAVMGSGIGPCLYPLDASDGPSGPRSPIARERPTEPLNLPSGVSMPSVDGPEGIWAESGHGVDSRKVVGGTSPLSAVDPGDLAKMIADDAIERTRDTAEHLVRALNRVCELKGLAVPPTASMVPAKATEADVALMHDDLSKVLGSKLFALTYLSISQGNYKAVRDMSGTLEMLQQMGLISATQAEVYDLRVT